MTTTVIVNPFFNTMNAAQNGEAIEGNVKITIIKHYNDTFLLKY